MKFFFCFLLLTVTAFTCNAQSAEAIKFDEYGSGLSTDEQDRLDEFARELKTQPEAQVYILVMVVHTPVSTTRAKTLSELSLIWLNNRLMRRELSL